MLKISKRQQQVIDFIQIKGSVSNSQIIAYLAEKEEKISRFTVLRDLENLLIQNILVKNGKGRNVKYALAAKNSLLSFFNPQAYFEISPDERKVLFEKFNFKIFKEFQAGLFSKEDLARLRKKNDDYQKRLAQFSPIMLKKSWKD